MTAPTDFEVRCLRGRQILALSTVAQSLVLQMPDAWDLLKASGASLTFAAAPDGWEADLRKWGTYIPIRASRQTNPINALETTIDVWRTIHSKQWDLIQTQTPIVSALARLVPRGKRKLVYVAHGFHFHADGRRVPNMLYGRIETILAGRTDALAVVSAEDRCAAERLGISDRTPTYRLPGAGIHVQEFHRNSSQAEPVSEVLRLLYVGEMNWNKDPERVVRVAKLISKRRPVHLTMVGNGPLWGSVTSLLAEANLQCATMPRSNDIAGLLNRSDILIAPSIREGLPRVIIEALAAGVGVVARSNRGSRELLADGLGQIMPTTATDLDWADAVTRLVDKGPDERRAARADEYGTAAFLEAYSNLISRTLTGEVRPPHAGASR